MLEVLLIKVEKASYYPIFYHRNGGPFLMSILKRWNDLVIYLVVGHRGGDDHASLRCHIVQNKRIGYS